MLYLNDHTTSLDWQSALPLLSEQRRQTVLACRHEAGRQASVAAYLLLCQGLREEYGITEPPTFVFGEHGKPSIEGRPDIHFSLSHCAGAAICALCDRPVGVDIETIRRYRESLGRYTMNADELAAIARSESPDLAFTRLWTMKEAVVKRSGRGITTDMQHTLEGQRLLTVVHSEGRYVYSVTI